MNTAIESPRSRFPRFGLVFLYLFLLVGAYLLMQVLGSTGGSSNFRPNADWRSKCPPDIALWEVANPDQVQAIEAVMSWFQPGGIFAGQSARTVLRASYPDFFTAVERALGEDAAFEAASFRIQTSQVHREWTTGLCYPDLTDDHMNFVRSVWSD